MARKKKSDPVTELLGLLFLTVILGVFYLTKSWIIAAIIGGIYFLIVIIVLVFVTNIRNEKLRASGIAEIDKMTGVQFEQYLMLLFQKLGYTVKTTPKTGDFGADLILHRDNRKIVVQAKRYSKNVGIKAVQEVSSATNYYNADEAWVVTNSFFTKAAIELSESNNVSLINRKKLIELILSMKNKNKSK